MNYSEHLQDFLDGSLDNAGEQSLFSELAANSALRAEMKDWLALKSAVWSDYRSFVPPVDATAGVFAALNFASPLAGASAGAVGAGIVAKTGWWSSLTGGMGASALGAVVAKSGVPFLMGWLISLAMSSAVFAVWGNDFNLLLHSGMRIVPAQSSSVQPLPTNALNGQRIAPQGTAGQQAMIIRDTIRVADHSTSNSAYSLRGAIPVYSASGAMYAMAAESYRSYMQESREQYGTQRAQATTSRYDGLSERIAQALNAGKKTADILERTADVPHVPVIQPTDVQTTSPMAVAQPQALQPEQKPISDDRDQFSVELRGISAQSLVTPTIGTGVQPFLTNGAIGIRAKVTSGDEVGIEAGREAYFQSFTLRNSENEHFRVEQQPVLTWAGIAYRHNFMPEAMFSPFVHSVLGVTEIGPMARGMAGVVFRPDARVSFVLGVESSVSAFRLNGAWFASPKIGVSYGVSISF